MNFLRASFGKLFIFSGASSKHMEATNNFSKYYKTISNSELLSILDNSSQYQPLAVEAAQNELLARQLSEEEIIREG